jgi:hypothetical protein
MRLSTHITAQYAMSKFDCHFNDSPLPSTSENRYIFGNTIKTDGFELQIVALDMDTRSTKIKLAKKNDYLTAQATIIGKKKYKDRGVLPVDVENNLDNYVLCGIDFNQVWFGAYSEIPETTDSPMVHNQIYFKMKALQEPTKKHLFYLKNRKDAYSMDQINLLPPYQNVDFNYIYSMERALEKSDQEVWVDYCI